MDDIGQMSVGDENDVRDVREFVIGAAAGGAANAGWPAGAAALIAIRAQEGVSGRMAAGKNLDEAFADSVIEAEMVMIMDRFSKTLDETNDPIVAYEAAMDCKRPAFEGEAGADEALSAALAIYKDALKASIAPHAAFLSSYITLASVMRKASAAS